MRQAVLVECQINPVSEPLVLGRVFKMIGDAVFEEKAGWQGATSPPPLKLWRDERESLYGALAESNDSSPDSESGRTIKTHG